MEPFFFDSFLGTKCHTRDILHLFVLNEIWKSQNKWGLPFPKTISDLDHKFRLKVDLTEYNNIFAVQEYFRTSQAYYSTFSWERRCSLMKTVSDHSPDILLLQDEVVFAQKWNQMDPQILLSLVIRYSWDFNWDSFFWSEKKWPKKWSSWCRCIFFCEDFHFFFKMFMLLQGLAPILYRFIMKEELTNSQNCAQDSNSKKPAF